MVIGWLDQGLWPLFQWMFVDAGNPVLQLGPFSGRPFESCRLVHGKYPIPLKMNDDYMRLMLWAVQLVMFGWIDASPTSVVSALLMWWFRRISMDPGIPDCVETTGRRSCHSVLKAMNQLFTFSVAVTDVVIAARKSAKHSTNSPVLKQPVQFWDKKIKKKFGTMLCFGRFCWVLANFPTTKVTFLKITSNPWRIGTGGVAAHALIADCRAVPQKKTNYGSFGVENGPGFIFAGLGICNPHISTMFWSVLLSTMPFGSIWRFPKMGARPNHPFEIVNRPFWAVHILGNLHFFKSHQLTPTPQSW